MGDDGQSLSGGTGAGALMAAALTGEHDEHHGRRDLATMERAVGSGWQIPDRVREEVVSSLVRIAIGSRPRSAIRAAEILRKMHADSHEREVYAREQGLLQERSSAATQDKTVAVRTRRV